MRRSWMIGVVLVALCACKESKQDKCNKTWDKMNQLAREMAKAFGGSDADMPSAAEKKDFLDKCMRLSDEALACATDPGKMNDPKCEEILDKAEEAEPVQKVNLAWETAPVADKRATAKVPKGWTHDDMMGDTWSPPDDAKLGHSSYEIENTCGGDCTKLPAAEWAKRIDDNDIANLKSDTDTTITKDEKLGDTGRLVISEKKVAHEKTTTVMVFAWQDGGETYYVCKAQIDRALKGNIDDFVDACKALKIDSFSGTTDTPDELGDDDVDAGK